MGREAGCDTRQPGRQTARARRKAIRAWTRTGGTLAVCEPDRACAEAQRGEAHGTAARAEFEHLCPELGVSERAGRLLHCSASWPAMMHCVIATRCPRERTKHRGIAYKISQVCIL